MFLLLLLPVIEIGLLEVFNNKGVPVRFFSTSEINSFDGPYTVSNTAVKKLGVKAVAEPCALMAEYKAELIQPKKIIGNVTVALARKQLRSGLLAANRMNTMYRRNIRNDWTCSGITVQTGKYQYRS